MRMTKICIIKLDGNPATADSLNTPDAANQSILHILYSYNDFTCGRNTWQIFHCTGISRSLFF